MNTITDNKQRYKASRKRILILNQRKLRAFLKVVKPRLNIWEYGLLCELTGEKI